MTQHKRALVRGVTDSYAQAIKHDHNQSIIDVSLAKKQHQQYCNTLKQAGVELIELPGDTRYPDCCFVEDTALFFGSFAIITHMKASSRSGETAEVKKVLQNLGITLYEITVPGNIDGGDVLQIDKNVYIGLSERTNQEGIEQVKKIIEPHGYQVHTIPIHGTLHLKTVCTNIGNDTIVYAPNHFDPALFQGKYKEIVVSPSEDYAANVLAVNGRVIVSQGYPQLKERLAKGHHEITEISMSEFKKSVGSLTCLSILL